MGLPLAIRRSFLFFPDNRAVTNFCKHIQPYVDAESFDEAEKLLSVRCTWGRTATNSGQGFLQNPQYTNDAFMHACAGALYAAQNKSLQAVKAGERVVELTMGRWWLGHVLVACGLASGNHYKTAVRILEDALQVNKECYELCM